MKIKKKVLVRILAVVCFICVLGGGLLVLFLQNEAKNKEQESEERKRLEAQKQAIEALYAPYVKVVKESKLYQKTKKSYQEIGTVSSGMEFELEQEPITSDTKYFHVKGYDFYLPYQDVEKIEALSFSSRYQKYLPQEEVTIKKGTTLALEGKLSFQLMQDVRGKVYRKQGDTRFVEYQNQLFAVSPEQLEEVTPLDVSGAITQIPVLVYHFIYLNGDTTCNESICFSENQIRSHFSYLKETGAFTMNTEEMKQFIKGEIQLPQKSVLITIDDGARAEKFIPFLEEYQLNATLFLITSWYDTAPFQSPYLEIASHGHDLHNPGVCPGGQGGGIKCLDEAKLQEDFRLTREKLNGTTAFCYPFYEYNDYAIEQLKKGGFEIAFMGGMYKATRGTDLMKVPRISLNSSSTVEDVKAIVEGA